MFAEAWSRLRSYGMIRVNRRLHYGTLPNARHGIPKTGKAEKLAIFAFDMVGNSIIALLEPFVEAFCYYNASSPAPNAPPHRAAFPANEQLASQFLITGSIAAGDIHDGVVSRVDRLQA